MGEVEFNEVGRVYLLGASEPSFVEIEYVLFGFSFGTGRCNTSAAPTSSSPANQPTDSERHSVLTRAQAGVCRKLTERCVRMNPRWSSVEIRRTLKVTV